MINEIVGGSSWNQRLGMYSPMILRLSLLGTADNLCRW